LSKHKKTCSKSSNYGAAKPAKAKSKKLNRLDFDVVKEQQLDEMTADYIAKRFVHDIAEVKDAMASDSYRTYKVL
jgi:hypothetical protein